MYNHTDPDYICPLCLAVQGVENDKTLVRASDVVYKDDKVMAFITSFFIGNNKGHVVIIPNEHFENIYDLPSDLGAHIFEVAQKMAKALKTAYGCTGITTLQCNEPDGGQHAFHYHFHVFPRYKDDGWASNVPKTNTTPEERKEYAEKVKQALRI